MHALLRHRNPALQRPVLREKLEHGAVGLGDVARVTTERGPAERAIAFGEQGADVRGHESRERERIRIAGLQRFGANVVAVVENLGTRAQEADHRLHLHGHAVPGSRSEVRLRLLGRPLLDRDTDRQVRQRIVGARLVGDDVDLSAQGEQFGKDGRRVAEHSDREGFTRIPRPVRQLEGMFEGVSGDVEVTVLNAAGDTAGVDVNADRDTVIHGHGEGLSATHAAKARRERDRAGERSVELLLGDSTERLERSLQNALRADVDPRARRHLAVHREAQLLEPTELVPVRPVAHEVGVGEQHTRGPLVGLHDADGLA